MHILNIKPPPPKYNSIIISHTIVAETYLDELL